LLLLLMRTTPHAPANSLQLPISEPQQISSAKTLRLVSLIVTLKPKCEKAEKSFRL